MEIAKSGNEQNYAECKTLTNYSDPQTKPTKTKSNQGDQTDQGDFVGDQRLTRVTRQITPIWMEYKMDGEGTVIKT